MHPRVPQGLHRQVAQAESQLPRVPAPDHRFRFFMKEGMWNRSSCRAGGYLKTALIFFAVHEIIIIIYVVIVFNFV